MSGHLGALVPEKICAPAARAVQFPELVDRQVGRKIDVGLQPVAIGDQDLQQFPANALGLRLERIEPRELGALEEFDRGEFRHVHPGRLRVIRLAHAHQGLEAQIHAPLAPPAVARADSASGFSSAARQSRAVGLHQLPCVRERFLDIGRHLGAGREQANRF